MKKGCEVKIPDIGPLAIVVQSGRQMVKVELEGEQFWIETALLQVTCKGGFSDEIDESF